MYTGKSEKGKGGGGSFWGTSITLRDSSDPNPVNYTFFGDLKFDDIPTVPSGQVEKGQIVAYTEDSGAIEPLFGKYKLLLRVSQRDSEGKYITGEELFKFFPASKSSL